MDKRNEPFLMAVGRLVQGGLTTDMEGKPLVDAAGAPRVRYYFGIAVEKSNLEVNDTFARMITEGHAGHPDIVDAQGNVNGLFAWKYVDGDNPKYAGYEGFPGCWIFRPTSGYLPTIHDAEGNIIEVPAGRVKRGDYVRAYVSVKANDGKFGKPGLFFNIHSLQVVAPGPEIIGGPVGTDAFKTNKAVLPQGAQVSGPAAGAPGTAAPGAMAPGATAPGAPGATAPGAPGVPAATAPAPTLPAAGGPKDHQFAQGPGYTMTALAKFTREEYHASNWSDEQLLQQGLMVAAGNELPY